MKPARIRLGVASILAACVVGGCVPSGTIRVPFMKCATERTYKADFKTVWKAAAEALKGYELVVEDDASGLLISDWIKGESDTYRYKDEDGKLKPCRCEFSIHAKVDDAEKGKTTVHIDLYERTLFVYPETGPVWKKTDSSTLREKAILDRISELLSGR